MDDPPTTETAVEPSTADATAAPAEGPGGGGRAKDAAQRPTLLVFDNPDKTGVRPSGDGPFMPSWPFRLLLNGPPGSGKRNMLMNVVFRLDPPPSAVHICHYDSDTIEYDELAQLGAPMYYYATDDFPQADNLSEPDLPDDWGAGAKAPEGEPEETEEEAAARQEAFVAELRAAEVRRRGASPLVIVDELTKDVLPRESASKFERLVNYCSTHRNTTVMCSIQDVVGLPPKVRRAFNQFCLWKSPDRGATVMAANRVGVPPRMLDELFQLCESRHDSIWVDATQPPDSPWRFRLNFLCPIRATETVRHSDYE